MIYTSFTKVVFTRDYDEFCRSMDIPWGVGSEKFRTPAESRTVAQFILAVNTGREAVFINFNSDLAVVVEPFFPNTPAGRELNRNIQAVATDEKFWEGVPKESFTRTGQNSSALDWFLKHNS